MQQQEEQPGQVWLAPELIELGEVVRETELGTSTNWDGTSFAS